VHSIATTFGIDGKVTTGVDVWASNQGTGTATLYSVNGTTAELLVADRSLKFTTTSRLPYRVALNTIVALRPSAMRLPSCLSLIPEAIKMSSIAARTFGLSEIRSACRATDSE
jgi:hypothetical protein